MLFLLNCISVSYGRNVAQSWCLGLEATLRPALAAWHSGSSVSNEVTLSDRIVQCQSHLFNSRYVPFVVCWNVKINTKVAFFDASTVQPLLVNHKCFF